MRLAHRYRNVLTEIERDRRVRVTEIMTGHADTISLADEVARLAKERESARQRIRLQRKDSQSRSESAEMRATVRELGAKLKAARAKLKAAKHTIVSDPIVQSALSAAQEHANQRQRDERAKCGVYWGRDSRKGSGRRFMSPS